MPLDIILYGDDAKADSPLNEVKRRAMGVPLALDAAPTSANGALAEGQWGLHSTNLYITISGTTYRITLAAV